jgi:hypothetical protein
MAASQRAATLETTVRAAAPLAASTAPQRCSKGAKTARQRGLQADGVPFLHSAAVAQQAAFTCRGEGRAQSSGVGCQGVVKGLSKGLSKGSL